MKASVWPQALEVDGNDLQGVLPDRPDGGEWSLVFPQLDLIDTASASRLQSIIDWIRNQKETRGRVYLQMLRWWQKATQEMLGKNHGDNIVQGAALTSYNGSWPNFGRHQFVEQYFETVRGLAEMGLERGMIDVISGDFEGGIYSSVDGESWEDSCALRQSDPRFPGMLARLQTIMPDFDWEYYSDRRWNDPLWNHHSSAFDSYRTSEQSIALRQVFDFFQEYLGPDIETSNYDYHWVSRENAFLNNRVRPEWLECEVPGTHQSMVLYAVVDDKFQNEIGDTGWHGLVLLLNRMIAMMMSGNQAATVWYNLRDWMGDPGSGLKNIISATPYYFETLYHLDLLSVEEAFIWGHRSVETPTYLQEIEEVLDESDTFVRSLGGGRVTPIIWRQMDYEWEALCTSAVIGSWIASRVTFAPGIDEADVEIAPGHWRREKRREGTVGHWIRNRAA